MLLLKFVKWTSCLHIFIIEYGAHLKYHIYSLSLMLVDVLHPSRFSSTEYRLIEVLYCILVKSAVHLYPSLNYVCFFALHMNVANAQL